MLVLTTMLVETLIISLIVPLVVESSPHGGTPSAAPSAAAVELASWGSLESPRGSETSASTESTPTETSAGGEIFPRSQLLLLELVVGGEPVGVQNRLWGVEGVLAFTPTRRFDPVRVRLQHDI